MIFHVEVMMKARYLSIGEAALYLGVSISSLRRWDAQQELVPDYRTPGGHRRYSIKKLQTLLPEQEKLTVGYCRVSGRDQQKDLDTQVARLEKHISSSTDSYKVIRDLGSGINYRKKGLRTLIKMIVNEQVKKIVVTDKDRLLRFGSELVFEICKHYGVEVEVLDEFHEESFEVTLAKDVITLITVFSSRLYGKRSGKNQKAITA